MTTNKQVKVAFDSKEEKQEMIYLANQLNGNVIYTATARNAVLGFVYYNRKRML